MRLRVLGSVEIEADNGEILILPRRKERGLLAILVIESCRTVLVERLCALLWDDDPPPLARRAVHTSVARIRTLLNRAGAAGSGVSLISEHGGYRLHAPPDAVDLHRFRCLLGEATHTTDPDGRNRLLSDALALWRGPALQNAASERLRGRLCADLDEQHMQAIEEWLATGLELGRHRELLPELTRHRTDHPLRDRLVELHMLALYRDGRTAEALEVYGDTRARLAGELGLDPSPGLQQLHLAILRGTPAASLDRTRMTTTSVRPAQLPPDQGGFIGRTDHLDRLDKLLSGAASTAGQTVVITAIAGTAGVGKTALAVHWAHRVRDTFPDGQLYVNLRGYAPAPRMRPIEALAGFLLALGIPAERVPADLDQATGLYRSLLADRRMLVVLDNAASPDQVRPLLPAAPGCLAVVTSRDRLGGLIAREGAHRISLDVLTPDEAEALLAHVLGADRVAAEPGAVAELARLCAYLPLAVRIAAANLVDRPYQRIAEYVDQLRAGDRLSALHVDGDDDNAVRAVFEWSYAALAADVQRLFRRVGLVPGADLTTAAAAALVAATPDRVTPVLRQLTAAHLLSEVAPGRYTCHDLLRQYAVERAGADDSEPEQATARRRLYDHYIQAVDAAVDLLKPVLRLRRDPADPNVEPVRLADSTAALAWVDAERSNLVAAVVAAADHGPRPAAWHLADALRGYFWLRTAIPDWLTVSRAGLSAAESSGDLRGEAAARLNLADAQARQGRYRDAIEHYRAALDRCRRTGWTEGALAAANNLGIAHAQLGDLAQAADHLHQALVMKRQIGSSTSQASALLNLAGVYFPMGRLAEAADYAAQAVEEYERNGSRQGQGIALCSLGGARHHLGHSEEAYRLLERGLAVSREVGDRNTEAATLLHLSVVHRDTGRHAEALRAAEAAWAIARDQAGQRLEADALGTLGTAYQRLDVRPKRSTTSCGRCISPARPSLGRRSWKR